MVDGLDFRNKTALGLALASIAVYAVVGRVAVGPESTHTWLVAYGAAWILYVYSSRARSVTPAFVLLWAAAARLALVGTDPWLSDDLYRYLLDGRLLAEGINPFRYAPADPFVSALEPELAPLVNHPEIPTIYPATVQLVAGLAGILGLSVTGWRVLVSVADLATIVAVSRMFGGGDVGWRAAAVYGLCPLAIWEAGANGHIEPLVALPMVLAVVAWRSRPWLAGLALAFAISAKFYPLVLLPAFARERHWKRIVVIAGVLTAIGMASFRWDGVDNFAGMRAYLEHWTFNAPFFALVSELGARENWWRALPYAVAMGVSAWGAWRRHDPRAVAPWALFLLLALGPTVHPWYALWVLPWLGPRPHWGLWCFVGAMGGAYVVWDSVARTGEWELPVWIMTVLWSFVALAWAGWLVRDRSETVAE